MWGRQTEIVSERALLLYTGELNQAFAKVSVRGIVLVTILQGVWILLVVAYLLRARSPSSREEADGRSI